MHVLRFASPMRYRWTTLNPGVLRQAKEIARFDVLHIFGYRDSIGPFAALGALRVGTPYVLETLGMVAPRIRSLLLKGAFDASVGRSLCERAFKLIATSALERNELVDAGIDVSRVIVRPNGVQPILVRPDFDIRETLQIPASDSVILAFGRVSRTKGLPLLVEAVKRVSGAWLVVAGPDDGDGAEEELASAVESAGISPRYRRVGLVASGDRGNFLRSATVVAMPSLTESFGNVALEAAALGTPVVLTDRCGVASWLGSAAAIVVPPEAVPLGNAIELLLDQPSMRAEMGEAGRILAAQFSWEHIAELQERIYEEALAGLPLP